MPMSVVIITRMKTMLNQCWRVLSLHSRHSKIMLCLLYSHFQHQLKCRKLSEAKASKAEHCAKMDELLPVLAIENPLVVLLLWELSSLVRTNIVSTWNLLTLISVNQFRVDSVILNQTSVRQHLSWASVILDQISVRQHLSWASVILDQTSVRHHLSWASVILD